MNVEAMNGAMLAFAGDAYYDLKVREMLVRRGVSKSHRFHQLAVSYVSAKAQAAVLMRLIDDGFLSDVELDVVRRGRNVKSGSIPKHTDMIVYRQSTAFEALVGYLYLAGEFVRLDELVARSIEIRDSGDVSE